MFDSRRGSSGISLIRCALLPSESSPVWRRRVSFSCPQTRLVWFPPTEEVPRSRSAASERGISGVRKSARAQGQFLLARDFERTDGDQQTTIGRDCQCEGSNRTDGLAHNRRNCLLVKHGSRRHGPMRISSCAPPPPAVGPRDPARRVRRRIPPRLESPAPIHPGHPHAREQSSHRFAEPGRPATSSRG